MSDSTRRRIALTAFLVFGALPTAAMLAWGLVRQTGWADAGTAQALSRAWGVEVQLAGVVYVRPGVVRYQGLSATHPETGQPLFSCDSAEAAWDAAGERWEIRAGRVEVTLDAPAALGQCLERLLAQPLALPSTRVWLQADNLTLRMASATLSLGRAEATGDPQAEWTMLEFVASPSGSSARPVLRVCRNRQVRPPAFGFELDTAGMEFDARWLSAVWPPLAALEKARFSGQLRANQTPAGWAGELTAARLGPVDLAGLLADCLPQMLAGSAQIELELVRFNSGRLEELRGALRGGPGEIARPLLSAAVERLGLTPGNIPLGVGPLVYEQLGVTFLLDSRGLRLHGLADRRPDAPRQPIVMGRLEPLVFEPIVQPQPAAALAYLLANRGELAVPSSPQAAWLLNWLPDPLPTATALDHRDADPPLR